MPDLIGRILDGKYRIDRQLGEGGQGTVYRGTHLTLDMPIAIKILQDWNAQDPVALKRFEREAKRAAQLKDPSIVTVHDFGLSDGLYYIVSEFVEGTNLQAYLKNEYPGPRSVGETLEILGPIANALDYAHEKRVIHRDIKPANILLDARNRRPVLCDFGLARHIDDEETKATAENRPEPGTPAYMSPEQCLGHDIDQRTDVYSFALIVYEMLCGKHPFLSSSDTSDTIRYKQVHEMPPAPRTLNPKLTVGVEGVLAKALAKSPAERYASVGAFVRALQDPKLEKRAVSRRWLVIPAALLGVAALAAAVWLARPRVPVVRITPTLAVAQTVLVAQGGPTGLPATLVPTSSTGAPQIVSPVDGATISEGTITLVWASGRPLPADQVYVVQVRGPDGKDTQHVTASERSVQQDLALPGSYTWTVGIGRMENGQLKMLANSAPRRFEKLAPTVTERSYTPTTTSTPTPIPAATATPQAAISPSATSILKPNPSRVTVRIVGLNASELACSTVVFYTGARGSPTVVERIPLAGRPENDTPVEVMMQPDMWFAFEGGPDGKCPWGTKTMDPVDTSYIQITGRETALVFAPIVSGKKGKGTVDIIPF